MFIDLKKLLVFHTVLFWFCYLAEWGLRRIYIALTIFGAVGWAGTPEGSKRPNRASTENSRFIKNKIKKYFRLPYFFEPL